MERRGIDAFWLKIIAIVGMTCNHIAHVFGAHLPEVARILLYAPGGLTFPIMAYLLVEGYRHTSDVKRYMRRLAVFAVISIAPFMWAFGSYVLDVLVTLLLGLVALYLNDRMRNRRLYALAVIGLTLVSGLCDWNFIGVPLIVGMGMIQDRRERIVKPIAVLVAAMEIALAIQALVDGAVPWADMAFFLGSIGALFLLLRYNGQRGRRMKFFFYAYYPAHLLILCLMRLAMFPAG